MRLRYICLAALVTVFTVTLSAQTNPTPQSSASPQATKPEIKKVPPIYTDPSSGKGMYMAYCASCHGADGKGNGPAAAALKVAPTNLTQLAAKNGGTFPDAHIMQVIKGDSATPRPRRQGHASLGPILPGDGTA